jgi:hypothetical protein
MLINVFMLVLWLDSVITLTLTFALMSQSIIVERLSLVSISF